MFKCSQTWTDGTLTQLWHFLHHDYQTLGRKSQQFTCSISQNGIEYLSHFRDCLLQDGCNEWIFWIEERNDLQKDLITVRWGDETLHIVSKLTRQISNNHVLLSIMKQLNGFQVGVTNYSSVKVLNQLKEKEFFVGIIEDEFIGDIFGELVIGWEECLEEFTVNRQDSLPNIDSGIFSGHYNAKVRELRIIEQSAKGGSMIFSIRFTGSCGWSTWRGVCFKHFLCCHVADLDFLEK